MLRFRIESDDLGPIIRLDASDLEIMRAEVGDVLELDRSGWRTHPTTDETERQIKLGRELMDRYSETMKALAKS
jgi:hypothetical protein